jgi:hypothetical protein
VVPEPALITQTLGIVIRNLEKMAEPFFQNRGQINLNGAARLARQIIDIVHVVALPDRQLAVFVDVKVFGIEFFLSELPEFFIIFRVRPFEPLGFFQLKKSKRRN